VKKSFVNVRPSDIPNNIWIKIVLPEPSKSYPMIIPRKGKYIVYKAYFPHIKDPRMLNIVFPLKPFERAIKAIHPDSRSDLNRPIQFEFKKTNQNIFIRDLKQL